MFGRKESSSPQTGRVTTVIGEDTQINGSMTSTGLVRIDGRFEGDIHSQADVVVGERGYVNAKVQARGMSVAGEVHGDLRLTGRLEILATGKVFGEVRVSALAIEDGGLFKGTCDMGKADSATDERAREDNAVGISNSASVGGPTD